MHELDDVWNAAVLDFPEPALMHVALGEKHDPASGIREKTEIDGGTDLVHVADGKFPPLAVLDRLVVIVATTLSSALTASKLKTPPELKETCSRQKFCPYR